MKKPSIVFSGAQGTGKSTLVHLLGKEFPEYHIHDSMSSLFAKDKDIQLDYNRDNYLHFQTKITAYHLNNMINGDNYICSRGIADSFAYMTYTKERTTNDKVRNTLENLVNLLPIYQEIQDKEDVINIYVPIMFDVSSEGNSLRSTDKQYQKDIDELIHKYCTRINAYVLKSLSTEDRIEEIKGLINAYKI